MRRASWWISPPGLKLPTRGLDQTGMRGGLRIGGIAGIGVLGVLVAGLAAAGAGCDAGSERGAAPPPSPERAAAEAREPGPIPERPASGRVHGQPFALSEATLDSGILELREGEGFVPERSVTVFLFLEDESVVPEGRSWDVDCREGWSAGVPHVHARWKGKGEGAPQTGSVACGYRLHLELGRETADGGLPGRIRLSAPKLETELAGRFEARIEGFRTKDGEPDLGQDDFEVLRIVAERWLEEREGGPVEITDDALAYLRSEPAEEGPQSGFGIYWWRPEGSSREPAPQKLRFAKRDGTWQVHGPLEPWQLEVAHPLAPSDDLGTALARRAAHRIEEEHRDAHGRSPLAAVAEGSAYNPKTGLAEIELRVHRGEAVKDASRLSTGEPGGELVRTLFRTDAEPPASLAPASWRLERTLEAGETVDFAAGRVVRR